MKPPWRRRTPEPPARVPDPTAIAVLEHDLYGIKPEPGTAAAVAIALRAITACTEHQPVETTTVGDPGPRGICTRCGQHMVQNESGSWQIAGS